MVAFLSQAHHCCGRDSTLTLGITCVFCHSEITSEDDEGQPAETTYTDLDLLEEAANANTALSIKTLDAVTASTKIVLKSKTKSTFVYRKKVRSPTIIRL